MIGFEISRKSPFLVNANDTTTDLMLHEIQLYDSNQDIVRYTGSIPGKVVGEFDNLHNITTANTMPQYNDDNITLKSEFMEPYIVRINQNVLSNVLSRQVAGIILYLQIPNNTVYETSYEDIEIKYMVDGIASSYYTLHPPTTYSSSALQKFDIPLSSFEPYTEFLTYSSESKYYRLLSAPLALIAPNVELLHEPIPFTSTYDHRVSVTETNVLDLPFLNKVTVDYELYDGNNTAYYWTEDMSSRTTVYGIFMPNNTIVVNGTYTSTEDTTLILAFNSFNRTPTEYNFTNRVHIYWQNFKTQVLEISLPAGVNQTFSKSITNTQSIYGLFSISSTNGAEIEVQTVEFSNGSILSINSTVNQSKVYLRIIREVNAQWNQPNILNLNEVEVYDVDDNKLTLSFDSQSELSEIANKTADGLWDGIVNSTSSNPYGYHSSYDYIDPVDTWLSLRVEGVQTVDQVEKILIWNRNNMSSSQERLIHSKVELKHDDDVVHTFDVTESNVYDTPIEFVNSHANAASVKFAKVSDGDVKIIRKGRTFRIQGHAKAESAFTVRLNFKSFDSSPYNFDSANAEWNTPVTKTYQHTYPATTTAIDTSFVLTHCAYELQSIMIVDTTKNVEFDLTKLSFVDILSNEKEIALHLVSKLSTQLTYYRGGGNFEVSTGNQLNTNLRRHVKIVGGDVGSIVKSGDLISLQGNPSLADTNWNKTSSNSYIIAKDDGDVEINSDCVANSDGKTCRSITIYAYDDDGGDRVANGTPIKLDSFVKFKFERQSSYLGIYATLSWENIGLFAEEQANHRDLWKIVL